MVVYIYCFESVGVVYGRILIVLFPIFREVSRNGSPSGLVSMVNLIVGCGLFSQVKKSSKVDVVHVNIAIMSSRYLLQRIDLKGAFFRCLFSKSAIKMFVYPRTIHVPMAVPEVCM